MGDQDNPPLGFTAVDFAAMKKQDLRAVVVPEEPQILWRHVRDAFQRYAWQEDLFVAESLVADLFRDELDAVGGSCWRHDNRFHLLCRLDSPLCPSAWREVGLAVKRRGEPILRRLLEVGVVKSFEGTLGKTQYALTPAGHTLRMQKLTKPITRKRADELLAKILKAVAALQQDPHCTYKIQGVYVYGSYLSDKAVLGDLDVAIDMERTYQAGGKSGDYEAWLKLDKNYAQTHGRRDGLGAVLKQLRVSPSVSIALWSSVRLMVEKGFAESRQVFPPSCVTAEQR